MAKKEFNLGDQLAEVLKNVSDPDRGPEQIVLLPIASIDADANNFYSMEGVEELAANIELIGLLDPLRVRENPDMPGRYLIVSGHRRRAAYWLLYEENPEKWAKAPCIVEPAAASPELQELRLIYANADTRKMSSADLSAQAERVEMLLYKLKDQGMEFPGRMRDHVAEACKVSATKLATLKVIRENLTPKWNKLYQKNKINETVAYEIAKQPPEVQKKIYDLTTEPSWIRENSVKDRVRHIQEAEKLKCKRTGGPCTHADDMLRVTHVESGCHSCFVYGCCEKCYEFKDCKFVCPSLLEKQAAERKKKKDARKEELAKEKARDQALIDTARGCWERFAKLRRDQSVSIERVFREAGRYYCGSWQGDRFKEFENGKKKITPGVEIPFANIHADDVQAIIKTAELFDCSTDFLLGRTPDPEPAAAPESSGAAPDWSTGTPPREGRYLCLVDMKTSQLHEQKCDYQGGKWFAFGMKLDEMDYTVRAWWPLPPESPFFHLTTDDADEEEDDDE